MILPFLLSQTKFQCFRDNPSIQPEGIKFHCDFPVNNSTSRKQGLSINTTLYKDTIILLSSILIPQSLTFRNQISSAENSLISNSRDFCFFRMHKFHNYQNVKLMMLSISPDNPEYIPIQIHRRNCTTGDVIIIKMPLSSIQISIKTYRVKIY